MHYGTIVKRCWSQIITHNRLHFTKYQYIYLYMYFYWLLYNWFVVKIHDSYVIQAESELLLSRKDLQ